MLTSIVLGSWCMLKLLFAFISFLFICYFNAKWEYMDDDATTPTLVHASHQKYLSLISAPLQEVNTDRKSVV